MGRVVLLGLAWTGTILRQKRFLRPVLFLPDYLRENPNYEGESIAEPGPA